MTRKLVVCSLQWKYYFALKRFHWWKIIMNLSIAHGTHVSVVDMVYHSSTAIENVLAL